MFRADEFVFKKNGNFFLGLEESQYGNSVSFQDGDMIKFNYQGKRYLGYAKILNYDDFVFELLDVTEI